MSVIGLILSTIGTSNPENVADLPAIVPFINRVENPIPDGSNVWSSMARIHDPPDQFGIKIVDRHSRIDHDRLGIDAR